MKKNNQVTTLSTGILYGKYSFGNIYDELFSEKHLSSFEEVIKTNLARANLLNDLSKLNIMDVGTGRHSIMFSKLGAKSVDHFDISEQHVDRFNKVLKKKYPKYNITSKKLDLVNEDLKNNIYDFVFLEGIVHHFEDVAKGLYNCARSVKPGGKLWCYFYRSGTFKWFVCSMIRRLILNFNVDDAFLSSALIYNYGKTNSFLVSQIMDDLYAPFISLYTPNQYIKFMKKIGFEEDGNHGLNDYDEINHLNAHHSATIIFKKKHNIIQFSDIGNDLMLSKENVVDQLNANLYNDKNIIECIDLYLSLEKLILKNKSSIVVWSTILSLHKIAGSQYYGGKELPPKYSELKSILQTSLEAN